MKKYKSFCNRLFPQSKRICVLLLALCLPLGGCRAAGEELSGLADEVQIMLGGEPSEVRKLRQEPVEATDGVHLEYYFQQLSEEEQRVYRQLLSGVREFAQEIDVTSADDTAMNRAYSALLKDHPELFWIQGRDITYKTVHQTYGSFRPGYSYTREEAAAIEQQIALAAEEVKALVGSESSDYEKARLVYEYVIRKTAYRETPLDQNIAGSLGEGQAVCAGYARAVQYLLEELGVECLYVSGTMKDSPEGHAWNIVKLEDAYYYLDATNGDQQEATVDPSGREDILYDYLCPLPTEFEALCQAEEDFSLPACTAVDYNDYIRNGCCFSEYSWDMIYSYICGQIEAGASVVRMKFTDPEAYRQAWTQWIEQEGIAQAAQYYMQWNGLENLQYYYGSLEDLYAIYFMF